MTFVKRLRLLAALLGTASAGLAIGNAVLGDGPGRGTLARPADAVQVATAAARSKFSALPTVTFTRPTGETVFAWQVRPDLPAGPARPRDYLVMIDTSASQAGASLAKARAVLAGIAEDASAGDRVDVWTINLNNPSVTRSLTAGFHAPNSEAVRNALTRLTNKEYGAGAVDLPAGLEKAAAAFERRAGRQQVLVFLGDGESAASPAPLNEASRTALGNKLADKDIQFFPVPLGVTVQADTLHGLAMQTGGAVVRVTDTIGEFRNKFIAAVAAPVLSVDKVTFGPADVQLYPTKLPPLRSDRATLVVGTLKSPAQRITAAVEGRVGGVSTTVTLGDQLAAPSVDHFFVAALVDQWKQSASPESPAVLAADRTLAMASEQYRLYRDEFTTQAVWAINADRLDHAEKLFEAALGIDPAAPDSRAGLKVVADIRGGAMKADDAKRALAVGTHLSRLQDPPAPGAPVPGGATPQPGAPATPPGEQSALDRALNAQTATESQFRILVDDTLRQAKALQNTDPDSAFTLLKNQRDAIANNDLLSEPFRRRLLQDLDAASQNVQLRAGAIKESQARERERISQVRQRRTDLDLRQTQEEQTKARVDSFRQLMNQARFELAQQEAQVMASERISRGQGVPPSVAASYRIGQAATNLREYTELKRIRENNFLLTMAQVDKSFVPYPDEPPVHFPPAAVWRELTAGRAEKFSNTELGPDAPPSFKRLRAVMEGTTGKRVSIPVLTGLTLDALLAQLQDYFRDDGVRFVFRGDRFEKGFSPGTTKLATAGDLSGLPLGSFLDTVLRDVNMSYIVRPEYIEIGPNNSDFSLRYDEKVTRVFDVAELVVGIPNAQSTSALIQNLQFLGQQATIFGAALVQFNGGIQGGALGGIGGIGGIGGVGIGGGFGGGGFGGAAGGAGFQGGAQGGAAGLQGALGGAVGAQMGQQGQLGQLGSAFSIQGNDQSQVLVQLITSVIAQGEWNTRQVGGFNAQALANNFDPATQEAAVVEGRRQNSLGFYPPARALIVRGSHRYHGTTSFDLKRGAADGAMGAGGPGLDRNGGQLAQAAPGNANGVPAKPDARAMAAAIAKGGKDPEKLWNNAFAGAVTRPELVIDAADVLFEMNEFGHAAEALKAALRTGRVNGIWTHDALAIALKQTQAAAEDVERASLSAIDLDPTSAACYLRAAKTEGELNRPEVALAFCKRAAHLEPNSPDAYADALEYAMKGEVRSDAIEWASTNLLKRDWAASDVDYHSAAKLKVNAAAGRLAEKGDGAAAGKLAATVAAEKSRDLVVQMLYQGTADLDLLVTEPSGSVCSPTRRRTTGGGTLQADDLSQKADARSETYTAAAAFAGTYTVRVKAAVGEPTGNRARVRVIKYQGTPAETVEVHSIDLRSPKPVVVTLDRGSRTELASVPEAGTAELSAANPADTTPTAGFRGGFGDTPAGTAQDSLPTVKATTEARVSGAVTGLPGLRLETRLGADRKTVVMAAKPVFTGPAVAIPVPRVNLVPR